MLNYLNNKEIISHCEIDQILGSNNAEQSEFANAERLIDFLLACIDNIIQYGHDGDFEIFPDAFDETEKAIFLDYVNKLNEPDA